ncbi:MAG: recombination protein NinG [Nitrosomonadaceae bacterium]
MSDFKKARDKADKEFSLFIRMRDAYPGGRCYTCNMPITVKACDAGHYIKRECMALRFDERNVHAQCWDCNRYMSGNREAYEARLTLDYGKIIIGEFFAQRWKTKHYSAADLRDIAKRYREKWKSFGVQM